MKMLFNFFKRKKENNKEHYYSLVVAKVVKETANAISIVFTQPKLKLKYKSGQFLTLILNINGKNVRRAYSLSSSPHTENTLTITIKRVKGGLISNYLNDNIKPGDKINVMEPMGNFTIKLNDANKRHFIMFGGGSGITPLMSHIKSVLIKEPQSIVSLIYTNRDIDSIIFKDAFQNLSIKYKDRFRIIHILDNAPLKWEGLSGLLNHTMLTNLLKNIPNWATAKTNYIMCGPEGMMNNVETLLAKQNISADKILKESFVAGISKKDNASFSSKKLPIRTVTISYNNEKFEIKVTPKETILDAALNSEIDLPYSCRSGVCTACRGKCTSGSVKMDENEGLSEAEIEEGHILPCIAHPLTDDVKIKIGG